MSDTIVWRSVGAAALLWFAFAAPKPPPETPVPAMASLVKDVVVPGVPADSVYLSALYEALGDVLKRDAALPKPKIGTTDMVAQIHASALQLAIDRKDVGKTPNLGESIDKAFAAALGLDSTALDKAKRDAAVGICEALAWKFGIGGG